MKTRAVGVMTGADRVRAEGGSVVDRVRKVEAAEGRVAMIATRGARVRRVAVDALESRADRVDSATNATSVHRGRSRSNLSRRLPW